MKHDDLIARAEAALEGVTPGPWRAMTITSREVTLAVAHAGIDSLAEGDSDPVVGFGGYDENGEPEWGGVWKQEDARFIAAARELLPALLAAVREGEEARQCVEIARDFLIWQTGADVNCTLSGVEFADAAKTTLAKIDAVLAAAGLVGEE